MSLEKFLIRLLSVAALLAMAASAGAATLEVTGPPGASVVINGRDLGVLPLASTVYETCWSAFMHQRMVLNW